MKSALLKDLLREIHKSWARFFSIFAIVLIGVACFAGIKATAPDMKHTADQYYDEYNMMDIRVMSTLGLTPDDIAAIAAIDQVEKVQAGYFVDAVSTIDSTEMVFRIHSLPVGSQEGAINQVNIVEGRYPENSGECLMERSNNIDLGLQIGDTIRVGSGKDTPITEDALAIDEFTIVGFAETPYYLCYDKGPSDVGNGKVAFFMMVPETDFIYPVYVEALITVWGARDMNAYGSAYEDLVDKVTASLENLGVDRSGIRLNEIKTAATEQLDAAKADYDEKKKEYDEEIANAEEELNQAQIDLVEGETNLQNEKDNFETQTAQAEEQIAAGRKELLQGEKEYKDGLAEYNEAMAEYGDDLATLNNAVSSINDQRTQAQASKADLEQRLLDPDLSDDERSNLEELVGLYDGFLSVTDEGFSSVNDLNNFGQSQLTDSEAELKAARRKLDNGWAQLHAAEEELEQGKIEAAEKFAQAEKDLEDGWAQYEEGKAEYEQKKADGEAQLADGKEQIIRAENEIERISQPQWYVLDRSANYSFVDYGMTADRIDAIAKIFPVFFFLVAALVCLTTMTRMVDEQRGNIGTYKALGYNNYSIAVKYVFYAAVASALGAAIGLAAGMRIFPQVIYQSWSMKYTLPPMQTVRQVPLMILSLLMGILVTTLAAFLACNKELKETPSLLMRPKSPKAGKTIVLERIRFFWKRLSFSQKVTARNLFRYKKRFFMTIIGIAGCTALLLAGFGLNNSIGQVVHKQFEEIFSYDLLMKYTAGAPLENKDAVMESLSANPQVSSYITGSEFNAKVKSDAVKDDISATLIVAPDPEAFKQYITLRNRSSQRIIDLGDTGVVISEKLAKELSVGLGDTIEMDNGDGARKKVEITGITENYVFHYVYMSAAYYAEIYRLEPKINHLMIKLNDTSTAAENELASALISDEYVASVTFYSSVAATFNETVKSLNSIVLVIIFCAGLLAFVVLYNLTNINISERIREIATIKVLGFFNREVASYVFRENVLLAIIGSLLGLGLGIVLHRFIMVSIEQEGIMFGNYIENLSFLYSFFMTQGFAGLVALFMYRRLKKIPMVESLKSVE